MASAPDDLIKRLESLERRMARLEALAGTGKATVQQITQLRSAITEVRTQTLAAPSAASAAASTASAESHVGSPAAAPTPQTAPVPAQSTAAPAAPPPTLRLAPIPPKEPSEAFPDLSLLDEKVEWKKGPPQKIDVRSALEDLPRICSRVQQLWGTPECEAYLNTLVIDTRGNRKGFPPAMMEELLYLGRLARALVILNVGGDLWDAYDQIGDRR